MEEQDQQNYELRFSAFQLSMHIIDQPGRIPLFVYSKRAAAFSQIIPVTPCGLEREFPGRLVYAGGVLFRSARLYENNELCPIWYGLELGMYREDFQLIIDQLKEKIKEYV